MFPHRTFSASKCEKPSQDQATPDFEDFYRYTSGRWLWAEEERLQERYKRFNVSGLQQIAAKASGAQSCVSITKLAEGGFNKVFRLSMDNGAVVIARIPNPNIGPAFKVTASEVTTMDLVRFNLQACISSWAKLMRIEQVRNVIGIPVPKVLAWDGRSSNSAESEYILMEVARGAPLEGLWVEMDLGEKFKVVDDVIAIQQKLQSVAFSRFGCPGSVFESFSDANESATAISISDRMRSKAALRLK